MNRFLNVHVGRSKNLAIFTILGSLLTVGCGLFNQEPTFLNNPELPTMDVEFPGNQVKHNRFVGPYRAVKSGSESPWTYFPWKVNPFRIKSKQETISDTPVIPRIGIT